MKFSLRLRWLLMPVLIFVVLPLSVRRLVYTMVEKNALVSRPVSDETPQTHGVAFTRVKIPRGTYSLDAVLTKVSDAAPVVVIFHGSAESVSYWADVQALFHKAGVSTFVFDYSGFGNSGGERKATILAGDVKEAWRTAALEFPLSERRLALGYSLGTGFVVGEFPALAPKPDALALVASYSSAREAAVAFGSAPRWAMPILPDLWNTVRNISSVHVPLLVMHSDRDQLFPMSMARQVFNSGNTPKSFVTLHGYTHEAGHVTPDSTFWAPAIRLARSGTLPASTD